MRSYFLYKTGKILKSVFIYGVLLLMVIFLIKNPLTETKNQCLDIRTAILISIGFAASFRTMLCCRKKV